MDGVCFVREALLERELDCFLLFFGEFSRAFREFLTWIALLTVPLVLVTPPKLLPFCWETLFLRMGVCLFCPGFILLFKLVLLETVLTCEGLFC